MELERLLAEYAGMMRYIVGGILPNPQDTEDCLSEIRQKIAKGLPGYDPAKGTLSTWLTAICRNTAVDHLRRIARRREAPLEQDVAGGTEPEEMLLQKERAAALGKALTTLSTGDLRLFYRKYYYLQPTACLAAELGLTERAVEGRLYRIRKKLQQELGGDWR